MTIEVPELSSEQIWSVPLQRAAKAKTAAAAVLSATISDAVTAGVTPTQVARQLGIQNRGSIYDAVEQARSGGDAERPTPAPVIWLRGTNADEDTWKAVQNAMWRRGWTTTANRTEAWHLAHSQTIVVKVDFAIRKKGDVQVGRVAATRPPAPSGLTTSKPLSVIHVSTRPVTYNDTGSLDADAVAIAVAEVIGVALLREEPRR